MKADLTELRDELAGAICAARTSSVGGLPAFNSIDQSFAAIKVAAAWMPHTSVEDLFASGRIWVVGMAYDDAQNVSRENLTTRDIPIQIAIQAALPDDPDRLDDEISKWVLLDEIVRDLVRSRNVPPEDYTWLRTESLKDPNGTPFAFSGLREGSYYESYFTAFYRVVIK